MKPPLVYVACPYGGNPARLADAADTVRKLNAYWGDTAHFWAPWVDVCLCLTERDRERGIAFDLLAIELSHGVLAIRSLPALSQGQTVELAHARSLGVPGTIYIPSHTRSISDAVRPWLACAVLPFQRRAC
jgi:hypothetical protein